MLLSTWWMILVFAIGAYAGITLMAMLAVAGRETPRQDVLDPMGEMRLSATAGALRPPDAAARSNRERRTRKRNDSKSRMPEPLEQQAKLQW